MPQKKTIASSGRHHGVELANNLKSSNYAAVSVIPTNFPTSVKYLTHPIPSLHLLPIHQKLYCGPSSSPPNSPPKLSIKPITSPNHPAFGQFGLFSTTKLPAKTWIQDYIGVVHPEQDVDPQSDYDLCLLQIPIVPSSENEVVVDIEYETIGIDATHAGNEARFINDFRGIRDKPNAVFQLREWSLKNKSGMKEVDGIRMSVWSGPKGIEKGEEICVSYGRGFWDGRK